MQFLYAAGFWTQVQGFKELPRWLSSKEIHLPMKETKVRSPGQEDPLKKEMATHSSILTWEIPQTEKPDGLQSTGLQESDMIKQLNSSSDTGL